MKLLNDGGPAFPTNVTTCKSEGMTLRDYFAGLALQGMTASEISQFRTADWMTIAKLAYCAADAMLTEREKTKECET